MKHFIAIILVFLMTACGKLEQSTETTTQTPTESTESAEKQPWEMDIRNEATDISNTPKNEVAFLTTEGEVVVKSTTQNSETKPIKQESRQSTYYENQPKQRGAMSYAEAMEQHPEVLADTGKYDNRGARSFNPAEPYEQPSNRTLQAKQNARNLNITEEQKREREALKKKLSTPYEGANGQLTRAQVEGLVALETGQPMPSHRNNPSPSYSNNNSHDVDTAKYTSNCDSSGCWGTDGTRYNSTGDGQNYYSDKGRFCQNNGGQIECH